MRKRPTAERSSAARTNDAHFSVPAITRVLIWYAVIATTFATATAVSPGGYDAFREPKHLALHGLGIWLGALILVRYLFAPAAARTDFRANQAAITIGAVAVGWTAISTIASTNRTLSASTLVHVIFYFIFLVSALIAAGNRRGSLYALLGAAAVNTIVVLLQATRIWDPFYPGEAAMVSALVGNPNWIGAYLIMPVIAAAAAAFAWPSRRWIYAGITALLFAGLLATRSLGAIGASMIALGALAALFSWKRALAAIAILGIAVALGVAAYSPLRTRVTMAASAIKNRDYNRIASNRLTPIAAALLMFRDRPLLGVGPGTYEWHYFEYKIRVESQYPIVRTAEVRDMNFGEAHSDHAEVLAVFGLPGYVILLACLWRIASASWQTHRRGELQDFARAFGLPAAIAAGILMITQFPLKATAASVTTILLAAAICEAWRKDEAIT